MKKLYTAIIFLLLLQTSFSQNKDCKKTCTINQVVHDGAFLGVQVQSMCDIKAAKIAKVLPESAALSHGLEVNDLITYVDDVTIPTAAKLINLIKSKQPYETIKITFQRGLDTRTMAVVLEPKNKRIVTKEVCCETIEQNLDASNVKLYPNPVSEHLNIVFNNLNTDEAFTYEIFGLNGMRYHNEKSRTLEKNILKKIDIQKLSDGPYVLKITQGEFLFSKLFIVAK